MPLLSARAIELLERVSTAWTDAAELGIDVVRDAALHELQRERLVESQNWPPVGPARRVGWRLSSDERPSTTQLRITGRGALRLQRIQEARRR